MENFETEKYIEQLRDIFSLIVNEKNWKSDSLQKILRKNLKDGKKMFRKDELVSGYEMIGEKNEIIEERIRLKPTRTNSGVVTVTVLTKPYPCPGNCIYCPNDPCMPKSYISSEPGAQRALANMFDPYAQVYNRLIALKNIGHNVEKVELIVLGGTWSYYQEKYQLSFIHDCYRALNDILPTSSGYVQPMEEILEEVSWEDLRVMHEHNEKAYCRNVGLVLETRPDYVTEEEAIRMRKLGATKVQIGIQSLSNTILKKNNIGRTNRDTKRAFEILRRLGFKIHGHWMPNLYGSTPRKDISDFKKLWKKEYSPDELKIYPTSVIANTKLYSLFKQNDFKPYTDEEINHVLCTVLPMTPRYCRLTRIIRDIPSNEIVSGNKRTNLRQIVEKELMEKGIHVEDIRSREIRGEKIFLENLELEEISYNTTVSKEIFLSYKTKDMDRICGFLRLSLPKKRFRRNHFLEELDGHSIIREVHVYGKVLGISSESSDGESQHLGLGKSLVSIAEDISKKEGFKDISVISAIGTREYYKKLNYKLEFLYMTKAI